MAIKSIEIYVEKKKTHDIDQAYISASFYVKNIYEFNELKSAYLNDIGNEFEQLFKEVQYAEAVGLNW